jgi:small subunit ribosomal protein S8e
MTKIGPARIHPVRARGGHIKHRALRLETGNFSWASEAITRKTRILNVKYNASNNELVRTNTLVKNCIIQIDATPFRQWYEQYYGVPLGKSKAAAGGAPAAPAKAGAKDEKKTKKPEAKKEAGKKETKAATPAAGKQETKAATPAKKETKETKKEAPQKEQALKESKDKTATEAPTEIGSRMKRKQAKRRKNRELAPSLAEQFTAGRLYACVSSRPGQCGRCDGYILEGEELAFYLRKMQKKKTGQ